MPLGAIGLRLETIEGLKQNDVHTVEDLLGHNKEEILAFGLPRHMYQDMSEAFVRHHLLIRKDVDYSHPRYVLVEQVNFDDCYLAACLQRQGIRTLEQLLLKRPADILRLPGFSSVDVTDIVRTLARRKLELRSNPTPEEEEQERLQRKREEQTRLEAAQRVLAEREQERLAWIKQDDLRREALAKKRQAEEEAWRRVESGEWKTVPGSKGRGPQIGCPYRPSKRPVKILPPPSPDERIAGIFLCHPHLLEVLAKANIHVVGQLQTWTLAQIRALPGMTDSDFSQFADRVEDLNIRLRRERNPKYDIDHETVWSGEEVETFSFAPEAGLPRARSYEGVLNEMSITPSTGWGWGWVHKSGQA